MGTFCIGFYVPAVWGSTQKFAVKLVLDDQVHDLVGARPDREQAHIAQQAFDGEDIGVPDPAQDLHGMIFIRLQYKKEKPALLKKLK